MSCDTDGFLGMKSGMVYGPHNAHFARVRSARQDVVDAAKLVAKRMARKSRYTAKCVKELMVAVDMLEEAEK